MKLKSIEITQNPSYSSCNPNRWVAKIEYHGSDSKVELVLGPDVVEPLLGHIAPLLVEHSTRVASAIAGEVLQALADSKPALSLPATTE